MFLCMHLKGGQIGPPTLHYCFPPANVPRTSPINIVVHAEVSFVVGGSPYNSMGNYLLPNLHIDWAGPPFINECYV